ncbi:hypothetical protein AB0H76_38995 [Nocardia sp. NPDC050712]|uniref:hypothetical protein n=1 Tax=Actinomycetes TaxID=1760 RepID=UPI0033E99D7B
MSIFNRTQPPAKMFGYPYAEVLAAHQQNVRELAAAVRTEAGEPLLLDKPKAWTWIEWGNYMEDIAEDLHTLREAQE